MDGLRWLQGTRAQLHATCHPGDPDDVDVVPETCDILAAPSGLRWDM